MPGDSLPPHAVEAIDRAAWRRWLMKHHGQAAGVWLVMASGAPRRCKPPD